MAVYEVCKRFGWEVGVGEKAAGVMRMFGLTEQELKKTMLDVRGGPSSFNAEMHAIGKQVVSCDSLYAATPEQLDLAVKNNLVDPQLLREEVQRAADGVFPDGPAVQ